MCYHLTLAVRSRGSLSPLRELSVELEAVEHPRLPTETADLQVFRVTRGWCACDLMREDGRESLAAALATIATAEQPVLAHVTWGDIPKGQRAVRALEPHDVAAFVAAEQAVLDRWVRLRVPFSADGPWPRSLDGARVVAVAAARGGDSVLAIVRHSHTPGATLLRCDIAWSVLDSEWFADVAAARDAAAAHGVVEWLRVAADESDSG